MAFSHGSKAKFWLDNSGGTLTDISIYVLSVTFPQSADTAETSTLGNTFKTYLLGLTDATISVEGRFDPTMDAVLSAALGATVTKTYRYDPQGSTTGLIRYEGECIVTSYQVSASVGDVSGWTAELQATSAITRSTIP